ncbi:mRNA guanylyltransferase [Pancytospora philotis]|nr:mRNA guanylyltransferase [Pancytospora philotis]
MRLHSVVRQLLPILHQPSAKIPPMEACDFGRRLDAMASAPLLQSMEGILTLKKGITDFIGSHPISLDQSGIQLLHDEDYLVCEKSDGVRVMLLIHERALYFYDRKNCFYKTRYVVGTPAVSLFDGEIYREGQAFRYAIFDTLIYEGKDRTGDNLVARLDAARRFVDKLRTPGFICVSADQTHHAFQIIFKQMMKGYGFYAILDSIPELKHDNDGLIFTPVADKYVLGARSRTLKWKPAHLNTVDFTIQQRSSKLPHVYDLFCLAGGFQLQRHRGATTNARQQSSLVRFASFYHPVAGENLHGKVGEFRWDRSQETVELSDCSVSRGGWSLYKIRTDKTAPNNIKVVIGVLSSIREDISETALRGYYKSIYKSAQERKMASRDRG